MAMAMPPSTMQAAVMPEFGPRAVVRMMVVMVATLLDDHSLGACDRRRCDDERAEGSDDVGELLHSKSPPIELT
jgi:hypothetical protein